MLSRSLLCGQRTGKQENEYMAKIISVITIKG